MYHALTDVQRFTTADAISDEAALPGFSASVAEIFDIKLTPERIAEHAQCAETESRLHMVDAPVRFYALRRMRTSRRCSSEASRVKALGE